MKKLIPLFLFLGSSNLIGETYTEFYCDTAAGSANTNSGSIVTGGSYSLTPAFSKKGFWTNSTCVFTNAAINPSGFSVGDWAAVYPDGNTAAAYLAKVTTTNANEIWLSTSAKAGTSPANDTAGSTWIVIGGAWAGPNTNGAANSDNGFPLNIMTYTATNAANAPVRVNFKTGSYNLTNGITISGSLVGPVTYQGYTSTPGDLGRATLTIVGASTANLITSSMANLAMLDFNFVSAQTSGTGNGISVSAGPCLLERLVLSGFRGYGVSLTSQSIIKNSEVNWCSLGGNLAGIYLNGNDAQALYCTSRLNTNGTSVGFNFGGSATMDHCISAGNSGKGVGTSGISGGALVHIRQSDIWNNGGDGIDCNNANPITLLVENCNIFKNGGYGVNSSSAPGLRFIEINNCAFGTGTVTNTSGNFNVNASTNNCIWYASGATPWVDPTNFNFTIASSVAGRTKGYAQFYQSTVNSPTNTTSYPDIGASQGASTNAAAASGGSYTFAQ